jgi:endonuclease I
LGNGYRCERKLHSSLDNLHGGLRSNCSMAMIDGEQRQFGACDIEIADRKIEPRPAIRGDIARI